MADNLTVDYKKLLKLTVAQRVSMARSKLGQSYLSGLTPSQYAALFPDYYKKFVPSYSSLGGGGVGGVAGGVVAGGAAGSGGGGTPSTSEAGTAYTGPQQSSAVKPPWLQKFESMLPTQGPQVSPIGPAGPVVPDKSGKINPTQFRQMMIGKIQNSSLNGFVPADGPKYGIKNGTPQEWANYFTGRAQHESGLNVGTVGDVGKFVGNSNGLFQLSPNDATTYKIQKTPFTPEQLRDPNFNADIALRIHEHWIIKKKGTIREDVGKYWGPVSRGWVPGTGREAQLPWSEWQRQDNISGATGILQQGVGETGAVMPGGKPSLGPGKEKQKSLVGYENMDPLAFWSQRNPNKANIKDVDKRLLQIRMMAALKFEEENPGKRVEIYGGQSGKRQSSKTTRSQHLSGRALDLAIYEIGPNGEKINKGGAYGNYPNFGTSKHGGMAGTAAAAHLYDRLNEYDEVARVYMRDVVGDKSYGFGVRIGTYFSGTYFTDQMHVDIGGELDKQGISVGGTAAGSVAYGMAEEYIKKMGIDPNSPEGQELLTGVLEKYGGTKEGVIEAAKAAFGGGQATIAVPDEYHNLPDGLRKEIDALDPVTKKHVFGLMERAKKAGIDPVQGLTQSYEQAQQDAKVVATAITETPPGQLPSAFSGDIIGSMENIKDPRYRDPQGGKTESEFLLGEGQTFNYASSEQGQKELGQFGNVKLTTIVTDKGTKVAVNSAIANDARGLLNEMEQRGYNIEDVSSYNPRSKRGSSSPSMHGWAAALDFNPNKNPFKKWKSYEPGKTDMPENMKYLFMKYGFAQIGSDRMHIERVNPGKRKAYLQYLLKEGIIPKNDPYVQSKINEGLLTDDFIRSLPEPATATQSVPEAPFPGPRATEEATAVPTQEKPSTYPVNISPGKETQYEIAGQPVQEGQPLTQEQIKAIGIAKDMDNKNYQNYPEHVRKQYEKQLSTTTGTATPASSAPATPPSAATPTGETATPAPEVAPTTGGTKPQGLGPTTPTVPETSVTPEKVPEMSQGGKVTPGENSSVVNSKGQVVARLNDREALRVEPASTMTVEERKDNITNFAADQSNPQSKQESRTEPPKASMRQEIQPNVRTQNMAFIDVIPAPSQESRAYQNAKGKKSRPGAGWNMEGLYHS